MLTLSHGKSIPSQATEDINSHVLYADKMKQRLPHAIRFNILHYVRVVAVDLGSLGSPMRFVFIGIWGHWWKLPICFAGPGVPTIDPIAAFDGGLLSFDQIDGNAQEGARG